MIAEGFHFQFPIYEPPSLAAKDNFCLSTRLSWLIRQKIDKFITVLFISRFALFLPGTNFVGGASEDLSASAKFDSRSGEKHDRVSPYTSFVF